MNFKYHYGQEVKIIKGFYCNKVGTITNYEYIREKWYNPFSKKLIVYTVCVDLKWLECSEDELESV